MPLTGLNEALDNIDAATTALDEATTAHAAALTDLAQRVQSDDISPEEIATAVSRAAASAEAISRNVTAISSASTSMAGIEQVQVEVPTPVEEVPEIEMPDEGTETPMERGTRR